MVLTGVMLLQSFVRWMQKMGHHYRDFTDAIHRIASNAHHILQLSSNQIITKTKHRKDRTFFIVMIAYMLPVALATELFMSSPSLQSYDTSTKHLLSHLTWCKPPEPPNKKVWSFNLGSDFKSIAMAPLRDQDQDSVA